MANLYDDLLNVKADTSVIPAYSMSFAENALFVAEAVEKDFNTLFQNIGIQELAVFESTGVQVVYENEKLDKFKDSIVKFFQTMWEKIKGAFEAVLKKFEELKKEAMKKIVKFSKSDLDKLDPEKKFGKTHKFDIDDIEKDIYGDNAKKYAQEVTDKFTKYLDNMENVKEDIAETKEELLADVCKKVSGLYVDNTKEMTEEIGKRVGDEVEADLDFVKDNFNDIYDVVINGSTVRQIKALYKGSKEFIFNAIKAVKKYDDERTKAAAAEVSVLKNIAMAMNIANGKRLDVYKRRYGEYRNILVRVAIALGKVKDSKKEDKKEESVGESVSYQLNRIDSMFNW